MGTFFLCVARVHVSQSAEEGEIFKQGVEIEVVDVDGGELGIRVGYSRVDK